MKSLVQTVGLLLALGVVVGGITFGLHYSFSPTTGTKLPPINGLGPTPLQLTFPVKTVERQEGVDREFEMHSTGHEDFAFWNAENTPLNVVLEYANCVCVSRVELCQLTPEESWRYLLSDLFAQPLLGTRSFGFTLHLTDCALLERVAAAANAKWQTLEKNGAPVTVQPQTFGLVRVNWKGDKEGPNRLAVDLSNRPADKGAGPSSKQRLEFALAFVPAVRIEPRAVKLEALHPRETAQTEFICWSSTRPQFKLELKPESHHPCFEVTMRPLTDADREKYAHLKSRLLSGYHIHVKVHERRNDKEQLDLGPLRKRFEFVTDASKEPVLAALAGFVRGEIALADSEDRDRLALGSFEVKEGKQKQFTLEAEQAGVELAPEVAVEPASISYVRVELKKKEQLSGGRTQWDLTVQVPPNRAAGSFPSGSAVVLKIKGDPPRTVRIPITGTAFNN